jgi:ribosomal protein S18 acetylase RimI-like enzyme
MTSARAFTIRPARREDLPALGRLGGLLMRDHYAYDPDRFLPPGDDPEGGYAWFLGTQLAHDDVAVLVAEQDRRVLGYAYAGIEPLSWKDLRDECGFLHDLVVAPGDRGQGIGEALLNEVISWLQGRGQPRIVLGTAERNAAAQRLFARRGFRRTMVEMTMELGSHP